MMIRCLALLSLLAACANANAEEKPPAKAADGVEIQVRIRVDTEKDRALVQIKKGKEWKRVVEKQMDKLPSYEGQEIVVPYSHKEHKAFFPPKQQKPVEGIALLVVVQQHHPAGLEFDGDTKELSGVVVCVHSYQFVVDRDGNVLKRADSHSRYIQKVRKVEPGKKPKNEKDDKEA